MRSTVKKKDVKAVIKDVPPLKKEVNFKNITDARPLLIPKITSEEPLNENIIRPFRMRNDDIKTAYDEFIEHSPPQDMATYLWREFRVMMISEMDLGKDGKPLKPLARFRKSIKRHVALFYGEYLLKGGTERRHLGLPVCRTIGITSDGEYETKSLQKLAGSQGTLAFHDLEYSRDGQLPPFGVFNDNKLRLMTKYFVVNRKKNKDETVVVGKSPSALEAERERVERDERSAQRIFGKEHYALSTVWNRGVVQPVCYEKQPRLRMIYPYFSGGDLVTLGDDQLAFYDPARPKIILNPDDTFLPRFFRQLVEAVYAIHQAGILHFDLKPENFVIRGPNRNFVLPADSKALSQYQLVILDFGLAMRLTEAEAEDCVKVGTDVTMAPEQVMCNHVAGRGTDWWSVAASMWRTRVFWEPTISDDERDLILKSKCEQWGHHVYPSQPFFSKDFTELLNLMFKPRPKDRDFSKNPVALSKLLDSPYLLRGLEPTARQQRLIELANLPPQDAAAANQVEVSNNASDAQSTEYYDS
jgi:serine/threonine protein kinase